MIAFSVPLKYTAVFGQLIADLFFILGHLRNHGDPLRLEMQRHAFMGLSVYFKHFWGGYSDPFHEQIKGWRIQGYRYIVVYRNPHLRIIIPGQ
jgi:hypothetical protein